MSTAAVMKSKQACRRRRVWANFVWSQSYWCINSTCAKLIRSATMVHGFSVEAVLKRANCTCVTKWRDYEPAKGGWVQRQWSCIHALCGPACNVFLIGKRYVARNHESFSLLIGMFSVRTRIVSKKMASCSPIDCAWNWPGGFTNDARLKLDLDQEGTRLAPVHHRRVHGLTVRSPLRYICPIYHRRIGDRALARPPRKSMATHPLGNMPEPRLCAYALLGAFVPFCCQIWPIMFSFAKRVCACVCNGV